MKLALLGADRESLRLAAAAVAAGHELVWQGDLAASPSGDFPWLGDEDQADQWEDLLVDDEAAAIIIGRGTAGDDLRSRQLQELARLGRPVLTTFPLFPSVLTYFEVDMARTESGALLQHYNPLLEPPLLNEAAGWIEAGHPELGRVEQIISIRSLVDRSREQVVWHFARDVEQLGHVAGRLNRIGAHAAAGQQADYAALSVQLLGASEIPVRWGVEPPAAGEGLTLTFVCQRGRTSLQFDAADQIADAPDDPAGLAVERFTSAIAAQDADASTWPAALHSMELADSIEISLRRGRMIDIHDQQLTEQLAFKGTMAAAGCGVLLVLAPLMLAVGWFAGLFGIELAQYWPHVLLAVLALFLGLQVLPKLLYDDRSAKE